jgi:hypothetical protein
MGKFNVALLRYLGSEDFRVLTSVNIIFEITSSLALNNNK